MSDHGSFPEWESMTPWEKAAQWREVAPELAGDVVALAKRHAEHVWKLEVDEAAHRHRMERRFWVTQLVGYVLGMVNVMIFALLAWHYSDVGLLGPGIATLSIGTAATAGVFAMGRAVMGRAPLEKGTPVPRRSESGST